MFGDTDTVQSVSVKEGDSVTLKINVTETQTGDKIEWKFGTNRNIIARIKGKTSNIFDGPDGRFRDRLKLDNQTGSLTITNTRTTDSGLYEAEISRSSSEDKHRFNVTVYGESQLQYHLCCQSSNELLFIKYFYTHNYLMSIYKTNKPHTE